MQGVTWKDEGLYHNKEMEWVKDWTKKYLPNSIHGKISLIVLRQLACIEVRRIVLGVIRAGGSGIVMYAIPHEPGPYYVITFINLNSMSYQASRIAHHDTQFVYWVDAEVGQPHNSPIIAANAGQDVECLGWTFQISMVWGIAVAHHCSASVNQSPMFETPVHVL